MSTRGAGRAPRRATFAALASAAALSLGACGSDDVDNNPRPPAPIEVTARVDSDKVVVSPDRFGAGLVNFTVANLSDSPVRFTLTGPKHTATPQIQPGAPGNLKVELPQGSYQATAGQGSGVQAATVKVGPERKSSQNELLLP
jgi:hypothetical protein